MDFRKRYVKSIDNIQFALGSFARTSRERDFVLLRKKMTGLICELDASGANNAFVMTMGNLIVVEFSGMGNALYGYDAQRHIPFDISKPLKLRVDAPNSLKHSQHIIKLSHQDGIHGWEAWEPMFQATLKKEFGITPGTASAPAKRVAAPPPEPIRQAEYSAQFSHASLNRLARENGLQVEDKTPQGGSLWVRTHGSDVTTSVVTQQLTRWGFKLRPGKGWWK
jgi:hypothetical protein